MYFIKKRAAPAPIDLFSRSRADSSAAQRGRVRSAAFFGKEAARVENAAVKGTIPYGRRRRAALLGDKAFLSLDFGCSGDSTFSIPFHTLEASSGLPFFTAKVLAFFPLGQHDVFERGMPLRQHGYFEYELPCL